MSLPPRPVNSVPLGQPLEPHSPGVYPLRSRFTETSRLFTRLHRYQLLLRKHWWILVFSVAIVMGPLSWSTFMRAPEIRYESKARMWRAGKLNIPEGKLFSEEWGSFMGTQIELMRSATIHDRALAQLRTAHPEWFLAKSTNDPAWFFDLEIKESPRASIFDLVAIGREPKSTRAFLNAVIDEYLAFKKETRSQTSDSTLASITDQVSQSEKELKLQQDKMHSFLMSNNVVFLQEQGSSAGSYLANINKQLAALRTEYQLLLLMTPEKLTEIAADAAGGESKENLSGFVSPADWLVSMGPQTEYFKATQQI